MISPDTLKDTCPHACQCDTQEECDACTMAQEVETCSQLTAGCEVAAVMDDGPLRGWKWLAGNFRGIVHGHAPTHAEAWNRVQAHLGLGAP